MNRYFSHWILMLALLMQFVSPIPVAFDSSGKGIWSVSCAGSPTFLPLPGDAPEPRAGHGPCLLCCDETRHFPDGVPFYSTIRCDSDSANASGSAPAIFISGHRAPQYPARAPPAISIV